jgi:transcriptional regulator with XRE-family HTH domain
VGAVARQARARRFNPAKLREVRHSRQLSQRQFAAQLRRTASESYSASLVAAVELGEAKPSVRFLEAVARAFEVDIRYFFTE